MILGAVAMMVWYYLLNNDEFSAIANAKVYETLPSFMICWLVVYVVSTVTYKPNPEAEVESDLTVRMTKSKGYELFIPAGSNQIKQKGEIVKPEQNRIDAIARNRQPDSMKNQKVSGGVQEMFDRRAPDGGN